MAQANLAQTTSAQAEPIWTPQAGPQTLAYHSAADIIGYGGAAGGGKALALDTPIPTLCGWTTMEYIKVGDVLFDELGKPCRVLAISDVVTGRDVYEITFDDGSRIKADGSHEWFTLTYLERCRRIKHTDEWRAKRRAVRPRRGTGKRPDVSDKNSKHPTPTKEVTLGSISTTAEILNTLLTKNKKAAVNHAVPASLALDTPAADLPIPPYTLGAWLGDGTSMSGQLTCADPQIVNEIERDGFIVRKQKSNRYAYGILGLKVMLRENNLLQNKHVPDVYLRASIEQRLDLLRGLMDTDGTADTRGMCEFYSTRWPLVSGVHELLLSLGVKCSIGIGRAALRGKDCGEKYRIKFTSNLRAFRLKRKADRQKGVQRGTQNWRYITDVRPVASEPVRCVTVDSPNHLYLAGRSMIPTHNSFLGLGLAAMKHRRSVIYRREFPSLASLIEDSRMVLNPKGDLHSKDSFNESLHRWRLYEPDRLIQFWSINDAGD